MLRSALLAAKAKADSGHGNTTIDENCKDGSKSGIVTPSRPLNGGSSTPRSASGGGFGIVSFKPFKLPSSKLVRDVPKRLANTKRKRINYKEDAPDEDDSDGTGKKPKKRTRGEDGAYNDADGGEGESTLKEYPTYVPKPAASVFSSAFSIPVMKDKKTGAVIETRLSFGALGVCRRPNVIPRPLHDPLADHAIVLWDPTVDDIETEEDKKKREEAEQEAAEKKKLQDKSGVHKSLAAMLGLDKLQDKDPSKVKVPVVIDPRLCKTLRPQQQQQRQQISVQKPHPPAQQAQRQQMNPPPQQSQQAITRAPQKGVNHNAQLQQPVPHPHQQQQGLNATGNHVNTRMQVDPNKSLNSEDMYDGMEDDDEHIQEDVMNEKYDDSGFDEGNITMPIQAPRSPQKQAGPSYNNRNIPQQPVQGRQNQPQQSRQLPHAGNQANQGGKTALPAPNGHGHPQHFHQNQQVPLKEVKPMNEVQILQGQVSLQQG